MSEIARAKTITQSAPLLREASGRRLLLATFFLLVFIQVAYLLFVGNGLARFSDVHSEADALRSAEAYTRDGLWSHHGLPRILYGHLFPTVGTVCDHIQANGLVPERFRAGFPERLADHNEWIYTHYPPGANLLCGLWAKLCGMKNIWVLRFFPLALGLTAIAFFFRGLVRAFGWDRAGIIAVVCAILPMFSVYLPGLHYQGYSFALLLLQLTMLLEIFWNSRAVSARSCLAFFGFGFLQGWLSFDQFFVVSLIALPLWLLRRTEGETKTVGVLALLVILPLTGFVTAHGLHFFQVAAELGGNKAALAEFRSTAVERAGAGAQQTYLHFLAKAIYLNLRETIKPTNLHYGPFMVFALGTAVILARRRRSFPILPLAVALGISGLWILLMPQHVVGNAHITVRHFFIFYFILCLVVIQYWLRRETTASSRS